METKRILGKIKKGFKPSGNKSNEYGKIYSTLIIYFYLKITIYLSIYLSRVQATDPDIGDDSVPQNITYFLDKTNPYAPHFRITNDGALR